jgi:hypothetical protein
LTVFEVAFDEPFGSINYGVMGAVHVDLTVKSPGVFERTTSYEA